MTPYEVYRMYCALKRHFTSDTYDYFKFNGKTRTSVSAFEKRNDKFFFHRLAKHKDPEGFIVANFINDPDSWVGDLVSEHHSIEIYTEWLKRKESLTYIFTNELASLDENLWNEIKVEDGQHPSLLKKFLRGEICAETMVILQDTIKFFGFWSKQIQDTIIWPEQKKRLKKYAPFVNIKESYPLMINHHVMCSKEG